MEKVTSYNLFVIIFAAFGSLFCGYGLAVIGNTLGQPTFYSTMNLSTDPTDPAYSHTRTIIGAANGIFFGAGFVGCLIAAWSVDALGRINTFRFAAGLGLYLVARALTGIPVGILIVSMPIYYSEVAPPHARGLMAGAHGCYINLGYCLAGWIGFACYYVATSTFGWRFPNAVLNLWAIFLVVGSFFIPESPRWLVQRQRSGDALKILCRLHRDSSDPENTFAHRELNLIVQQLEADRAAVQGAGRWQLFTEKTYRKRLILALMIAVGGQNAGILVINNYNVLLYQSLGLKGSMTLLVAAVWNTVGLLANVLGAATSDRTGRRTALVYGYLVAMSCFIVATGLIGKYAATPTKGMATAATVFLFLYVLGYGCFIDTNQFTVVSEIFPSHIRGQAVGIAMCGLFLADTLWLELQPTAQGAIGWKYYLVFACLGIVHMVFLYFFLPETSGLALEEIDQLFGKQAVGHLDEQLGAAEAANISATPIEKDPEGLTQQVETIRKGKN